MSGSTGSVRSTWWGWALPFAVVSAVASAEGEYECARLDDGVMALVAVSDTSAVVTTVGRRLVAIAPPTASRSLAPNLLGLFSQVALVDAGRSVMIHQWRERSLPYTEVRSIADGKLLFSDRVQGEMRPEGKYSGRGACVTSDRTAIVLWSSDHVLWEWRPDRVPVVPLGRTRVEDGLSDLRWCARAATRAYFARMEGELVCAGVAPATDATGATDRPMKVRWRIGKRLFLGWDADDLASEDGVTVSVDDVAEYGDDVGVAFASLPWEDFDVVLGFSVATGKPLWRRVVPVGDLSVHVPERDCVLVVGATSARSLDPATGKELASVELPGAGAVPVSAMSVAPSGESVWRALANGRVLRTPWKAVPLADASKR